MKACIKICNLVLLMLIMLYIIIIEIEYYIFCNNILMSPLIE